MDEKVNHLSDQVQEVKQQPGSERPVPYAVLGTLVAVDLGMKIWAISTAVRRGDKKWILPLALVNSVGILPAVYLATRH